MVDSRVARVDPANFAAVTQLERNGHAFCAEPQPDSTHRAHLSETREDAADRRHDGLVGMKADLAILLAPYESDRQSAAQLAKGGLVTNAAIETSTEHIKFGLAHGALGPEQEAVVEERRMIDAVGIADQGVRESGEIDEAVSVGIVARKATEHDPDVAERNFRCEASKTRACDDAGTRESDIFVDHHDAVGRPSKLGGLVDQCIRTIR
jgi:hypothetical protein